jgi:hypothetical protein
MVAQAAAARVPSVQVACLVRAVVLVALDIRFKGTATLVAAAAAVILEGLQRMVAELAGVAEQDRMQPITAAAAAAVLAVGQWAELVIRELWLFDTHTHHERCKLAVVLRGQPRHVGLREPAESAGLR